MEVRHNNENLLGIFNYYNMCSDESIKTFTHTKNAEGEWSYFNLVHATPAIALTGRQARMARLGGIVRQISSHAGLKFQISLDDSINGNMQKAWDLAILPNLIKHNVSMTKICTDQISLINPDQDGKQVTIYAYRNNEKNENAWNLLFHDITTAFVENQIKPGPIPLGKTKEGSFFPLQRIEGSQFITWQFDANESGLYSAHKIENNAPDEIKTMCNKLNVSVAGQAEPISHPVYTHS